MSLYRIAKFSDESPAMWIGLTDWRDDAHLNHDHPFAFTKEFQAPIGTSEIRVRIASSTKYAVYVDQKMVHEGPARSISNEAFVDDISVLCDPNLREHTIVVLILPPLAVTASQVQDRIGLIAEIVSPQNKLLASTDGTWRVLPMVDLRFCGRVHSLHTSQQEHWNLAAIDLLRDPGKNAAKDTQARVLGPIGTPPWAHLIERDCAILKRSRLETVVAFSGCDSGEKLSLLNNPARAFNARSIESVEIDAMEGVLELNDARNLITLDAGRTRMVRPIIEIMGADADVRLEIYYDIGLASRPTASLGFEADIEGFVDSIETSGRSFQWQPIMAKGARYVTIRKAGRGACRVEIHLEAVNYPYPVPVEPPEMDEELRAIWMRSVDTIRSSTTDVLVDTCWRENMLWTFDAAVTGQASFIAFGDMTMWRRSLSLIARWHEKSGAWPSSVAPAGSSAVILPDQSFWAMISLSTYAAMTRDRGFAAEAMGCFGEFLEACEDQLTDADFFVPPGWCWHWIDWAPIDRRPYSLPINLLLLLACESALDVVQASKFNDIGTTAARIASRLRPAVEQFWDESAGCFADHLEPKRPLPAANQVVPMPSAKFSAHGNALAIKAKLGSATQQKRAATFLAANIEKLPFSPGYTGVILETLIQCAFEDAAMSHLRTLYRPWLIHNQPTWSEAFEQVERNTGHGWGASALMVILAWVEKRDARVGQWNRRAQAV